MNEIEGECWTPVLQASAPDCFRAVPGGIRLGGPGIVQDAAGCWQARIRNPSRRRYGPAKWLWADQIDPRAVTRYRGRICRSVTGAPLPAWSRLEATCGNPACLNPDHLDLIEIPAPEHRPEGGHYGWAGDGEDEVYCWIADPLRPPKPPKAPRVLKGVARGEASGRSEDVRPPKPAKVPWVPKGVARGERSGQSKLTAEDVRAIRAAAATSDSSRGSETSHRAIAARYGISAPALRKIITRQSWAHVD